MKSIKSARRARRATIAVALLAGVALAACGGDDSSSDDSDAPVTTAPGSSAAPDGSTAAPAEEGEPVAGGELVVGTIFDPFGLEPTTLVGQSSDGVLGYSIYDPLMTYDENSEAVGWLAESMTSQDAQHWTIKLRPDVVFHDGTPFDAEAVKVNFERHQDPALKSRELSNASKIVSMTVVDPLTLELELEHPWASFDQVMTTNLGLMASPTAAAAGTLNEQPVGTGPFVLAERIPGDRVVLERNENYWRDGEPYLDRMVLRVMLDDSVRLASVGAGEIDAAQSVSPEEMTSAAEDGLGATTSAGRARTIYMNTQSGPTADVNVRQAMAMALDYAAINDVVFEGEAPSDYRILSSTNPYFDESIEFPQYDPDEAARLVEEYEAANGDLSLTLRCYTGPTPSQMSQLVTQMWTAAGIDVTVELSDQATLVTDMLAGRFQVGCLGTTAGSIDPDLVYFNTLHSTGRANYMQYSNPEMDAALELGRQSSDPDERMEAYRTVQEIYARDMPVIEWAKAGNGWVLDPAVRGLVALPGSEFRPSLVWLDQS